MPSRSERDAFLTFLAPCYIDRTKEATLRGPVGQCASALLSNNRITIAVPTVLNCNARVYKSKASIWKVLHTDAFEEAHSTEV